MVKVWACAVFICLLAPGLQSGEPRSGEAGRTASTYRVPQIIEGETISVSQISDEYIGRACTVFLKPGHSLGVFSGPMEPPGMTSYEENSIRVSGEMAPSWQEGEFTVRAYYHYGSREAFGAKYCHIPYKDIDKVVFEPSWGQKLRDLITDIRGKTIRKPISALRDGDVVLIHRYRNGYTVDAKFIVNSKSVPELDLGEEALTLYGLSEREAAEKIFYASLRYEILGPCSVEFSRPLFLLAP